MGYNRTNTRLRNLTPFQNQSNNILARNNDISEIRSTIDVEINDPINQKSSFIEKTSFSSFINDKVGVKRERKGKSFNIEKEYENEKKEDDFEEQYKRGSNKFLTLNKRKKEFKDEDVPSNSSFIVRNF